MNASFLLISRGVQLLGKIVLSVLVLSSITDVACTQGENSRPYYGVTPHRIDLIPPGTAIDNEAPKGWSHLIIKSHPHPGTGDMARVNESTYQLASFIFTGFLANVRTDQVGGQVQYRLERVAVGLGTNIKGRDMIISPDTQQKLGANLGLLARVVFDKTYQMQQDVLVVVSSSTLAVIDTPAVMLRGNKHRPVILRYTLVVDPKTGHLDTVLWLIDKDEQGRYVGPSSPIEWLPANKVQEVVLHVDGSEFTLGVPSENAFAATTLPQGKKQIVFPDDLKPIAGQRRLTVEMAQQLERRLKEILEWAAQH